MGQIRRVLTIAAIAAAGVGVAAAQVIAQAGAQGTIDSSKIQEQLDQAKRAMEKLKDSGWQGQLDQVNRALEKMQDSGWPGQLELGQRQLEQSQGQLEQAERQMERAQRDMELAQPALDRLNLNFNFDLDEDAINHAMASAKASLSQLAPGLAFAPFQQGAGAGQGIGAGQSGDAGDRAREAADRAREAQDRVRESRDRAREAVERASDIEQRRIDTYRRGTDSVDEGRYERAISSFDSLIEVKWPRNDGVYYWKAYALNKLGKRDEALAALAEIPKQFPQSRWINDAKALQVEIQQNAGRPVSPDSIDDQDLKLLALTSVMNSDPVGALPLVEKVLNDPKNNLSLKAKALFVLAQSRNEKARDIVAAYAKSGSNPDLQIRAIGYLGSFRSANGQQILADIYAANNDVAIRRAVLRGMANSRDSVHLFNAAKTESNADLRREAIRSLGNMQASNELGQLYGSETNNDLKQSILQSLMSARSTDKLIEIAKIEKNAELRADAIRYLGNMRSEKSADTLASIYASETDKNVKAQIIRSLGSQGAGKQLVEVTRNEKDRELKGEGVQWLGRMKGSKEATDYLMELINK